jgi:hypothetical protein
MFVLLALAGFLANAAEPSAYPPVKFPDSSDWGRNIQRTMRLLATSTPQQRNTVRILFYGQSITEQGWAKLVEDDLRRRFPHANLIVENRALGGFASQMLVKTAETDLYPFQPDLLIFHVYGAHDSYEDIIRRTRERTTAEILMQNDHGEWLMAECVKAYLRYDPHLGPSPAEDWVKTLDVGKEVKWADGTLQCEFTGRRVDAICGTSDAAPAAIRIDGRKPSERAELYGFTRAVTEPQGKWLGEMAGDRPHRFAGAIVGRGLDARRHPGLDSRAAVHLHAHRFEDGARWRRSQ